MNNIIIRNTEWNGLLYSPTTLSSMNIDWVGWIDNWHSYRPRSSSRTDFIRSDQWPMWRACYVFFLLKKNEKEYFDILHFYLLDSKILTWSARQKLTSTRNLSSELYVDKPTVNNWKSIRRIHETFEKKENRIPLKYGTYHNIQMYIIRYTFHCKMLFVCPKHNRLSKWI